MKLTHILASSFFLLLAVLFITGGVIDRTSATLASADQMRATVSSQLSDNASCTLSPKDADLSSFSNEMLEEAGCEMEIDTNIHHRAHPIPILAHIFGGVVMMLAAVVTLNPTVQTRYRRLHRIFGYAYIPAAIITGICAVWLTASFPQRFVPLNVASNLLWGAGLTIFPIIALYFVLNKKIQNHRSWMIRSYALAAGPAMHRLLAFTYIGPVSEIMGGAFWDFCISVMTIVFAELYIRRMGPFRRGFWSRFAMSK